MAAKAAPVTIYRRLPFTSKQEKSSQAVEIVSCGKETKLVKSETVVKRPAIDDDDDIKPPTRRPNSAPSSPETLRDGTAMVIATTPLRASGSQLESAMVAAGNAGQTAGPLQLARQVWTRTIMSNPAMLINMLCNTPADQISSHPGGQEFQKAARVTRDMLYYKLTGIYGVRIYLHGSGKVDDDDAVLLEHMQGLLQTKAMLESFVVKPFNSDGACKLPAQPRVASIHGVPGLGKRTLIKAVCQTAGINLIEVNVRLYTDGMLTEVIQYALLQQPSLIYFDHCEDWFCDRGGDSLPVPPGAAPQYQPFVPAVRGLELTTRMRTFSQIENGSANVWIILAVTPEFGRITGDLRKAIGSNHYYEYGNGADQHRYSELQFFAIAENCWYRLLQKHNFALQQRQQSVEQYRTWFAEVFKRHQNFHAFTPAMIKEVIETIFAYPRNRISIKDARFIGRTDLKQLLPTLEDVEHIVSRMIHHTTPGVVHWHSAGSGLP